MRPYTGNTDGAATREGAGLRVLVNFLLKKYPGLWDNGTFGIRDMKGFAPGNLSVHGTGRAVDLSYRFMKAKGLGVRFRGRKQAVACANWLVANDDTLGLEMIIDYLPTKKAPFGRTWKCTRDGWLTYTKLTVRGSDWLHVEIAPTQANSAILMRQALARCT